jgi:hypothetical protein
MNSNQYQPSGPTRSTQSIHPIASAGHHNHPHAPYRQIPPTNLLHALHNPSKAHTRPYLYSNHPFPIHVPGDSPDLSSSASTPSHAMATPSPILSVRTLSTRHSSLQPPSTRPTQPPSAPVPHDDTRSILSKHTRHYIPSSPASHPTSPIPPPSSMSLNHPPHLPLPSLQLPTEPSLERPAKRLRLDVGCSNTAINCGSPQPLPGSQSSSTIAARPKPKPKSKKGPLHPTAVDYGRPMKPVVPQPPSPPSGLQSNDTPPPPFAENTDPKRLLDDALKGPVDPATAKELGDLMFMQQRRVWDKLGGFADPFLAPIPISLIHTRSSSSCRGVTPAQTLPETIALYGPAPRNSQSIRLGEGLTNPNVILVDDDDDDGFDGVLDLYLGAVQGSTLSVELELAVGDGIGLTGTGWADVSSLEVSIKNRSFAPSPSGEPKESRVRTLAGYEQAVEAKTPPPLKPANPNEEPPLGIEWSYSCYGYATGRVVNPHRANLPTSTESRPSNGKRRWES